MIALDDRLAAQLGECVAGARMADVEPGRTGGVVWRDWPGCLRPCWRGLALALLLLAASATPVQAKQSRRPPSPAVRWAPVVAERVELAWPLIRAIAVAYRLDPQQLAALVAWETGCTPITGGLDTDCHGAGQVCWGPQGARLRREGIAARPAQLRSWIGLLAAGRVLALAHRESERLHGAIPPLCVYAGARKDRCTDYQAGVEFMRVRLFGAGAALVASR